MVVSRTADLYIKDYLVFDSFSEFVGGQLSLLCQYDHDFVFSEYVGWFGMLVPQKVMTFKASVVFSSFLIYVPLFQLL